MLLLICVGNMAFCMNILLNLVSKGDMISEHAFSTLIGMSLSSDIIFLISGVVRFLM